jgi:uncharacterized membrane protein YtjA (UPF0391 family)
MIFWAATFLIIALLGAWLGFSGADGVIAQIARILFVIALALAVLLSIARNRKAL